MLPAYWSTTYISTDATALAAGGIAAWLTMRALDGVRGSLVLLPVAAAVATLFKLQNLIGFAVGAAISYVNFLLIQRMVPKMGRSGAQGRSKRPSTQKMPL